MQSNVIHPAAGGSRKDRTPTQQKTTRRRKKSGVLVRMSDYNSGKPARKSQPACPTTLLINDDHFTHFGIPEGSTIEAVPADQFKTGDLVVRDTGTGFRLTIWRDGVQGAIGKVVTIYLAVCLTDSGAD